MQDLKKLKLFVNVCEVVHPQYEQLSTKVVPLETAHLYEMDTLQIGQLTNGHPSKVGNSLGQLPP